MRKIKPSLGWLPLIILPLVALSLQSKMQRWVFMWALAFAIFAGLKWQSWWVARNKVIHPAWRSLAYFAWPGMDARTFLDPTQKPLPPNFAKCFFAFLKAAIGAALLWLVARQVGNPELQGWIGMLGLIFLLHFGSFDLLALFWQSVGVKAQPIMTNPALSSSLSDFWGRRWNLGFRQLSYDLIFRPLWKSLGIPAATFLVFVASGLIHDLVISVPAGGGYGLPTAYFTLQGVGVLAERSQVGARCGLQKGIGGWLFMILCTCTPLFWLFHPPFIHNVILPFMHAIHAL